MVHLCWTHILSTVFLMKGIVELKHECGTMNKNNSSRLTYLNDYLTESDTIRKD